MSGAFNWGKGHLIGIVLGIIAYELYTRKQSGNTAQ